MILVGGGGLGVTAVDLLAASGRGRVVGVLDDQHGATGKPSCGARVEGAFSNRAEVARALDATEVLVTIGGLRHMLVRGTYLAQLEAEAMLGGAVMHPSAVIGGHAVVGRGSLVGPLVVLGPKVTTGRGFVAYSAAVVEHESTVGNNVYLAPGVLTGGRVRIGDDCYLGIGARLADGVSIGPGSIIGAGAVVLKDVPAGVVALGVPARVVGPNTKYRVAT